ncbi:hypothetical protein [Saccharibacillus brassicae]|uniref:Uncharacterized protein n=1 Tax=Saccharibacillus brassicae TaxID=2583377 RepID=A0A4Y6V0N7_SACBS|nr:hypothetical protein [Saccharibacillus brassicae]QDH22944.1 hypothetical protein FFV09_20040 [Saccharibacillus brassicae]
MFLKKDCFCGHCFRTFQCTGAFGPDGARYISGPVAWMKLVSKEPGKLLLEGSTTCIACTNPHRFLVEYDCAEDRYVEIGMPEEQPAFAAGLSNAWNEPSSYGGGYAR